jgi:hypothetical protein
MSILAKASDNFMVCGEKTIEGVVEYHIHGVDHDKETFGWKLRKDGFEAIHFHRKSEGLRERRQIEQMCAMIALGAGNLELPTIRDPIRNSEMKICGRVGNF